MAMGSLFGWLCGLADPRFDKERCLTAIVALKVPGHPVVDELLKEDDFLFLGHLIGLIGDDVIYVYGACFD